MKLPEQDKSKDLTWRGALIIFVIFSPLHIGLFIPLPDIAYSILGVVILISIIVIILQIWLGVFVNTVELLRYIFGGR